MARAHQFLAPYELAPKWGIRTVLIKASGVKTPIWDKGIGASTALMEGAVSAEALRPYRGMCDEILATARYAEESGITPEEVAATIEEALTAPQPRTRYLIGNGAWLQMTVRRLMPDWLWDSVLLRTMPKTTEPLQ
ncbi:hypothetical protein TSOC_009539 [Tetrabaena socialis]|uniref:Uncharacterized protein n=1 Tax=Tetrabaena socialis TaxID=47790 RepID=A0A2J7ZVK4_9CHLO|nr:hypothetical protein TSOC_009539 [Tetrabaena socialis]|eukprot:PNH04306.1 hypothetical protein TSOC_009539 [Tetrabaena socialis]